MKRKSIFTLGVLFFYGSITLNAQQSQKASEKNNKDKPKLALGSVTEAKSLKVEQPKAELKMFSVVEENGNNTKPKAKVAEPQLAPYSIETNPK